jgi:hypothetical protein
MLSVKQRQKRLKYIGLYDGKIDGKENKKTKAAYLKLQKKYFPKDEQDGRYGANTEILLVDAYRVKKYCTHFKLEEFRCGCKGKCCTGYPAKLSKTLLKNLEKSRSHLNVPMSITSGLRCPRFNTLCGGASFSKHKEGKAVDFVSSKTKTFKERKAFIKWFIKLSGSTYAYCYKYGKTKFATYTGNDPQCNYPDMYNATHIDTK